jgi:hypothetical protein
VSASIYKHFDQERSYYWRAIFKLNSTIAPSEWRVLGAA